MKCRRAVVKSNQMAPRPVHPTNVRHHGLFGMTFVRQHMVADERWTPGSLTEQFKGMTDLLTRRTVFKKLEANANRKRYVKENRNLKLQCRDGRSKLQLLLNGDNTKKIRNFLINHKDMQRLYQKMPVHLVVDNINQRTFVMRKERDRLLYRLNQLKKEYEEKLLARAAIENRIKYENEFILEEEIKSQEFRKKIENSHVRLKAIKTINSTYKKMIQVLLHDEIFYEPILRSLSKDIEDQANFIKHILYLGMPAIAKFKELSEEYRQMEDKARKNLQAKIQWASNFKKIETRPSLGIGPRPTPTEESQPLSKRYVRETVTMLYLKNELEAIEGVIKQVKFATLCYQAKEIYPRIKSQVENNVKLHKLIANNMLGHQALETKGKRAEVLQGVLLNNLSEEEIARLNRISQLEKLIYEEDQKEANQLAYIKNRADAYVLLRYTLWNLNEILRYVDKPPKIGRQAYPNSYLKLPLLKFEMLTMRAVPPEIFEDNIDVILSVVQRKVAILMRAFRYDLTKEEIAEHNNEFHLIFLDSVGMEEMGMDEGEQPVAQEDEEDLLQEAKNLQNVPNRKQIKALSAKIVEERSKKDE